VHAAVAALAELQHERAMVHPRSIANVVARIVIADWTGIPVGNACCTSELTR
jgi:hypothetical protein